MQRQQSGGAMELLNLVGRDDVLHASDVDKEALAAADPNNQNWRHCA